MSTSDLETARVHTDDELRSITSYDDAVKATINGWHGEDGTVDSASELLGNGFLKLAKKDKAILVDVPMIILDWSWSVSDEFSTDGEPSVFAVIRLVTNAGDKYVITDGGAGIPNQLHSVEESRKLIKPGLPDAIYRTNLAVARGLRASSYPAQDGRPAGTTYYLATER